VRLALDLPLTASVKESNVPEAVPGPYKPSLCLGRRCLLAFQFFTLEPGCQIFFNSFTVKLLTQSFFEFTTTVNAS